MLTTYPDAVDPAKVGEYSSLTFSGGGRFYDDVLEYRVWCHPGDGDDYYCCFETYAEALKYSRGRHWTNKIKEEPIVVVRQLEWVAEDEDGVRSHETGERITEWRTEWLDGSKRTEDSIRDFLAKEDE